MELQFLVMQIICLAVAALPSATSLSPTSLLVMPNDNCTFSCGDVQFSYPFGIGSGCYFDSWFEVDCREATNNLSSQVPFIKSINLELLSTTASYSSALVNVPVMSSDKCSKGPKMVNFEGSPFFFSTERNLFVAVGCNKLALLTYPAAAYDNKTTVAGGCWSTCDSSSSSREDSYVDECYGINCCQTSLPSHLQTFSPNFKTLDDDASDSSCSSTTPSMAFIIEKDWFSYPSQVAPLAYVPVVLEWVLLFNETQHQIEDSPIGNVICTTKDIPIRVEGITQNVSTFQCRCSYAGNPYLKNGCLRNPWLRRLPERHPKYKAAIMGVCSTTGAMLLVVALWYLQKVLKKRNNRRRKEKFFKRNGGLLLQQKLYSSDGAVEETKLFNSKELEKATDRYNADRILGHGGQGTVYKGMLSDGKIVAVKKSKTIDEGRADQFINEVVLLSRINHRNVVKLLGCCLETEVPTLVYEFIPNGTLFQLIHNPNEDFLLTWEMRLQIATEVAGALYYLHYAASMPIYHRDIKSSNILLDDKYKAKVSDFGISRSVTIDQTHLTTLVQGTFGYLDPEYFQSSQFTEKSDVYSFGVVVVELLTGRKPISRDRTEESRGLAACFIESMDENKLVEILDPLIMEEGWREEMVSVAQLAKRCLNMNGKMRPTVKEVAVELEGIRMSRGQPSSTSDQQSHHQRNNQYDITTDSNWSQDVTSTSTLPAETCFHSATASSFDAHLL